MKDYGKNQSDNKLKKIKENDELKTIEVNVVTKYIEDEVETSSDGDVDVEVDVVDNDDEWDRINGFR